MLLSPQRSLQRIATSSVLLSRPIIARAHAGKSSDSNANSNTNFDISTNMNMNTNIDITTNMNMNMNMNSSRNMNINNNDNNSITRRTFATAATATTTTTTNTTTTRSHEIKSRLLGDVHPLQLFRIVQDVDQYSDFLPLCSESRVFPETIREGGRSFRAELVVGFGSSGFGFGSLLRTRYVSQVSVDPESLRIETISDGDGNGVGDGDGDGSPGPGLSAESKDPSGRRMFESLSSCWQLRPVRVPVPVPVPFSLSLPFSLSPGGIKGGESESGSGSESGSESGSGSSRIGTVVDFRVEMTVSDPVTVAVLNQVLYNVAESQVTAFHQRCQTLPSPSEEELELAERFFDTTTLCK